MTDVLENKRNLWQSHFGTKQVIMIVLQFFIREMVPPGSKYSVQALQVGKQDTPTCLHRHTTKPATS